MRGARAIVTALTYHTNEVFEGESLSENDITYVCKGRKLQKDLAVKLFSICDIPKPEQNCGLTLDDMKKIETKLDIQIYIVCAENFNSIIYSGSEKEIKIYLHKC